MVQRQDDESRVKTFDLGDGKQVVIGGYLKLWAFGGSLGICLTPDQEEEIGLALWHSGRRRKRNANLQRQPDKL